MENINFILCIAYFILSVLNLIGKVNLSESAVFGMTVGTLFLCLAPLHKEKIMRVLSYIMAAFLFVAFPLIENTNTIVADVDANTWLLLSIAVTFLSNFVNNVRNDKKQLQDKKKQSEDEIKKLNIINEKLLKQKKDKK